MTNIHVFNFQAQTDCCFEYSILQLRMILNSSNYYVRNYNLLL